jgi:hypothetical protein
VVFRFDFSPTFSVQDFHQPWPWHLKEDISPKEKKSQNSLIGF